jgi:hypothetical protein
MLVSHTCTFAIDRAEQGRVEPLEPTPVEGANYDQDQGKATVHLTIILEFILFFFYLLFCDLWMCIKF